MSTPLTPAHVLGLTHSTTDQSIDSTFDGAGRNSFASISPLSVADDPCAFFCRVDSIQADLSNLNSAQIMPLKTGASMTLLLPSNARPVSTSRQVPYCFGVPVTHRLAGIRRQDHPQPERPKHLRA